MAPLSGEGGARQVMLLRPAKAGAEFWGAERRRGPAGSGRIGASDTWWLKAKQTRGGVQKEGKREERREAG